MTTNDLPGAGKRVALFATCVNDVMFPETPKAVVRLLERLGCEVDFPPAQTCCGQMFTNTGYFDEALPSSLYMWFAMRDLMPTWGEDSVNAGLATGDEAQHLDLDPGSPVLHISRRAFCRENVVEVTRSVYRADRYTLWVPVLRPEHLR